MVSTNGTMLNQMTVFNSVCGRVSKGCPGTKIFPCPAVPLSRDKGRSKNPGTNSSVQGCPFPKKKQEKAFFGRKLELYFSALKFKS